MPSRSQRHLRETRGKDSAGDVPAFFRPEVSLVPIITGLPKVGSALSFSDAVVIDGTKGGQRWEVAGLTVGTGATYTVQAGDVGKTAKVYQEWSNTHDTIYVPSNPSAIIIA